MIYTGQFGDLELFPNSLITSGMYKEILTCHIFDFLLQCGALNQRYRSLEDV